jgi:hypothetical protein
MRKLTKKTGETLQSVGGLIRTESRFKAYLVATNRFLIVRGEEFYLVDTTGLNNLIFKG